jgi:hypothetical protein
VSRAAIALLAAAALWWLLHLLAGRMVYYPIRYPQGWWQAQTQIGAEDVWLTASDGVRLHAWWVPAAGARLATLFLHGNGGNLSHRAGHLREITAAGSSVLILDYRGYGRSAGRPTEAGLYRDGEAAYRHLLAQGHPAQRIVLHGESLGTAVAVHLAARFGCAGLIVEAPLTSAREMAGRVLPLLGPLLVWGFDSKDKIARVRVPLLVLHGDRDQVIPYEFGRALFAAANEPKQFWTIAGAGHNDILDVAGPQYGRRLRDFYEVVDRAAPPALQ